MRLPDRTKIVLTYLNAVAAVGAVLLIRRAIGPDPHTGSYSSRHVLFFIAIGWAAWIGGAGPGIVASLLAVVFAAVALGPTQDLSRPHAILWPCVFFLLGVGLSVLIDALRRARRRAESLLAESRLAQERLAEERRFSQSLVDQSPNLIYVYDLVAQRNIYSNRAIEQVLGYSPDQVRSFGPGGVLALIHPDDQLSQWDHLNHFTKMADGDVHEHNFRMRGADGRWRWLTTRESIFRRDPAGVPTQIIGVSTDTTDRRAAEDAVRASEHRLSRLINLTPVGIFQTDTRGHCTFVNEHWSRMAGLALDEARGEGWSRVLHPDDRDRVAARWYADCAAGRDFRAAFRYLRPDRTTVSVVCNATSLLDADGLIIGYIGTVTDVTGVRTAADRPRDAEYRPADQRLAAPMVDRTAAPASPRAPEPDMGITLSVQLPLAGDQSLTPAAPPASASGYAASPPPAAPQA